MLSFCKPIRWRHQMETFSASLALCEGNPPVTGAFHSQRPVTRSFDVFFDQRLNKRLSKQSKCWWFKTPSRSLLRHCNSSLVYPIWRRNQWYQSWPAEIISIVDDVCLRQISLINNGQGESCITFPILSLFFQFSTQICKKMLSLCIGRNKMQVSYFFIFTGSNESLVAISMILHVVQVVW